MNLGGLFALAFKNPFWVRKRALENCLKRANDENTRARLEYSLKRVRSEEFRQQLVDAMMPGELNGRRTNYN
jgi:hypothetical protein